MRVMGLDVGDRRIGVAMSDPTGLIASPHDIIVRQNDDSVISAIQILIGAYKVERIVVGMPYSLSGAIGPAAERVQMFVNDLAKLTGIEVTVWDERLSTVAAERSMRESRVKKERRKNLRDAVAAALILQGYLDRQHPATRP